MQCPAIEQAATVDVHPEERISNRQRHSDTELREGVSEWFGGASWDVGMRNTVGDPSLGTHGDTQCPKRSQMGLHSVATSRSSSKGSKVQQCGECVSTAVTCGNSVW